MFDVLVLISTVRRDLLAGVHTILGGSPGLVHKGWSGQLSKYKIFPSHLGGLFLLIAGAGPASSSHGRDTSVQYLQGSETQHRHERGELRQQL